MKRNHKIYIIILIYALIAVFIFAGLYYYQNQRTNNYKTACRIIDNNYPSSNSYKEDEYINAIKTLEKLDIYLDSWIRAERARYNLVLYELSKETPNEETIKNNLDKIRNNFEQTKIIKEKLQIFLSGKAKYSNAKYYEAFFEYSAIMDFPNINNEIYACGIGMMDEGYERIAIIIFQSILDNSIKDGKPKIQIIQIEKAVGD